MRRIVHLSDLHFGWNDQSLVEALCAKVREIEPHLTVVSGDFVEHATKDEFVQAKRCYDSLPKPCIAVPGNHDLPFYNFARRIFQRLRLYREYITDELAPFYQDDEIAVIGVDTARIWQIRGGSISAASISAVEKTLCSVPPATTRILVTHHPFDLPAEYGRRYLLRHGETALQRLACCLDVLLAGHMHIGASGRVADRFVTPNGSLIFSQAGTAISKRYKGERNSFNLIDVDGPQIRIRKYSWDCDQSIYAGVPEEMVYVKESPSQVGLA
jgi:3',5'-cyclic AMP phosphodiesterase CpdA